MQNKTVDVLWRQGVQSAKMLDRLEVILAKRRQFNFVNLKIKRDSRIECVSIHEDVAPAHDVLFDAGEFLAKIEIDIIRLEAVIEGDVQTDEVEDIPHPCAPGFRKGDKNRPVIFPVIIEGAVEVEKRRQHTVILGGFRRSRRERRTRGFLSEAQ